MKIKVCGMRYRDNLIEVAALKPDYLGFIFYDRSPRYAAQSLSPADLSDLDLSIQRVGVFVNETFSRICKIVDRYHLNIVQLHGDESPELCSALQNEGIRVVKAFRIKGSVDPTVFKAYGDCTDGFLLDTANSAFGGSGKKFDWSLLNKLTFGKTFFLSGGIGSEDAETIKSLKNPQPDVIDINSRFELEPGRKDLDKLKDFFRIIRTENHE